MQRDMHICYVDYVKVFDKVQHKKLFRILEGLGIYGKDLELIKICSRRKKQTLKLGIIQVIG